VEISAFGGKEVNSIITYVLTPPSVEGGGGLFAGAFELLNDFKKNSR
jgi:hypothetical protein